ncbi:MAG: AzlC family ABC transporter permease [Alphaproteobacteria bacterium]|nr:AzlC family ABC transporter permease [Rhizobiaceae bacterium]MBU3959498.1 AzlC family ABC transporter permease [Alphaproteobacteria bacterium]MBU4049361.1 AzlC family ABC transporter permease [Alphaproteobacteria bacterium]MBU4087306.1 AzlC family ABC transporter permease [Alphaproteobacteria bacterium]MBU4154668.1 AzlC family ABC transporter permease [Alphaproteobacteria bacterium]
MSQTHADAASFRWFLQGARGIFSLPAFILMTSFVGFSAFALESGVSRGEAMFMTAAIWALPAKMILIGMMASGANVLAVFLAVTLSSIRMMPMVASLVPELRGSRTPTWLLLILSHFVAITAWVFAMGNLKHVPREARVSYFAGFGLTLVAANTVLVGLSYGIVSTFPPAVAGILFFLTPVYFVGSIWASARHSVVKIAFVIGVVAGPLLAVITPGFDILIAGIGGGTLAYLIDRFVVRRRAIAAASSGEAP